MRRAAGGQHILDSLMAAHGAAPTQPRAQREVAKRARGAAATTAATPPPWDERSARGPAVERQGHRHPRRLVGARQLGSIAGTRTRAGVVAVGAVR